MGILTRNLMSEKNRITEKVIDTKMFYFDGL